MTREKIIEHIKGMNDQEFIEELRLGFQLLQSDARCKEHEYCESLIEKALDFISIRFGEYDNLCSYCGEPLELFHDNGFIRTTNVRGKVLWFHNTEKYQINSIRKNDRQWYKEDLLCESNDMKDDEK